MPSSSLHDRAKETGTTTGTGNFTLAGAVAGYESFNTSFGTGTQIEYLIEAVDANGVPTGDWEVGDGYLSDATTLVRDMVRESSNGDALVNFSAGTKNIVNVLSGHRARGFGRAYNLQFGMP